jgi:putative transposase
MGGWQFRVSSGAGVPACTPYEDTMSLTQYRRRLPHWRMEGAVYFVTWRLHSSQAPLNHGERTLVKEALLHFDGQRYQIFAYVVMDDHVHVLFIPLADWEVGAITHTWKSFTANQMQRRFHRRGAVWRDESLDRIVRNDEEFQEKGNYILDNPRRRWPEVEDYEWVGLGKGE